MDRRDDGACLISGASSGIGLALAHRLAARGARVAITGTNADKLRSAVDGFPRREAVLPLRFDVTDAAAWLDAVDRVERSWGPIRFLALNAGIGMGGELIETVSPDTWRWALDVNLMGVVNGLKAWLPRAKCRAEPSQILITASIAGVWRTPTCGPYNVSKAAVVALAETLRLELAGSATRVSLLLPGAVRTGLPTTSARSSPVPMRRDLVDQMTTFLASGADPDAVAEFALTQVERGAFYVFTHAQADDEIAQRIAEMTRAMDIILPE